jgi:hypothetical protein
LALQSKERLHRRTIWVLPQSLKDPKKKNL